MRAFGIVAALVVTLAVPSPSPARATRRAGTTPTITTVAVVPNPSVAGQNLTLTATVSPGAGAAGTPTGTVQFLRPNGTPFDASLINGQASATAWVYAGTYTVRADYAGDATFAPSTGTIVAVVDRAGTTTTVSSSSNPVSVNGSLRLTVVTGTVAPGDVAPAGTVGILLDGLDVSGPIPLFEYTATASAVVVQVPGQFLALPGSATISAYYSGDADTLPSQSAGFVQSVVGPAPAPAPAPSPVPTVAPAPKAATSPAALSAMTATLTRALARRGLTALTATKQRLSVTGPGTLVQRVYSPAAPATTTTSAAKPALIAAGSRAFPAAGTRTMTLRLTAAGRLAVRKGKTLKLAIVTRFTGPAGAAVTSSAKVTVKPKAKPARWAAAPAA